MLNQNKYVATISKDGRRELGKKLFQQSITCLLLSTRDKISANQNYLDFGGVAFFARKRLKPNTNKRSDLV